MKRLLGADITGNYVFSAGSKTVTFSNLPYTVTLANLLLITNVTANIIIYNFADPASGAVSFVNNVLTLDYNTTSMSSSDVLQIYLDVESYEESNNALLRRMVKLLESQATVDSANRQRIAVETMPTTTVTGTVNVGTAPTTAVTNTTGVGASNSVNAVANPYTTAALQTQNVLEGPVDQRWRIMHEARTAYATGIRSNLIST
jgi:hypothetical protein